MCKVRRLSVQLLLALLVLLFARGHEGTDMQLQHEIELEHLGQATNEIPREEKELVREDVAEHERKLMLECQHSDYRTYIKCLKRDKRQQFHRGDQQQQGQAGPGRSSCLDQCFQVNCTSSACIRDCHSHCRQKLIETYSKTIETSYDCQDNECKERDGDEDAVKHANHTTIVNVNNNINLTTSNCSSSDKDKSSRTIGHGSGLDDGEAGGGSRRNFSEALMPKIELNNIITNQFGGAPGSSGGYGSPDGPCACPGCNCGGYNLWPQIPQITIGIGGGGGGGPMQPGGCIVPMSWPCFQQRYPLSYQQQPQPQQQQQSMIDCSQCANPFLRYQCDPACYSGGGVVDVKYNATGAPVSNPLPQQQQQQQQQQSYPRLTPRTWNNGIR